MAPKDGSVTFWSYVSVWGTINGYTGLNAGVYTGIIAGITRVCILVGTGLYRY